MNFMLERTGHAGFKKARIVDDSVPHSIADVARALTEVPARKLAIVADYAVGSADGLDALSRIAMSLGDDHNAGRPPANACARPRARGSELPARQPRALSP